MAIRTRNIYKPNQEKPFKLSRSKIELYMSCPRCFYIDRRLGVGHPPGFPFNINSTVDELLKKEFDKYRLEQKPHPYMLETGKNLIPFQHEQLDNWRANFKGVQFTDESLNLTFTGAVDDIWYDLDSKELIVVDYKATSKKTEVTIDEEWQGGYRRQIDFYQWLLRKNGFKVSNESYFVYCNGDKSKPAFDSKVEFKVSVLKYIGNDGWIEDTLVDIKKLLEQDSTPDCVEGCSYCEYLIDINSVI
jgi:CRISPR/Cas system-associated exonuclease Cas4 (RecB family)